MNSQKQKILNMLIDQEWTCTTEMMAAYIPDFRRRICDLKDDGYILMGKPCNLHDHKSKNLKMWHLISAPQNRVIAPTQKITGMSDLYPITDEILTQPQQVPLL